ncbi:MAG TPA: hypothetical protein PK358_05080 [Spirochaetota bacterium]|nr:hypothetical protein [Spirochaetota bacterium]HPJ34187.1 hypothetical protein [Spirochaetota bacterium]
MNEQLIVEGLIRKFRFEEPVTPEIRRHIASSKAKNLKKILKKENKYGLFTGLAIMIFIAARKMGLTISFLQAAIVSGAVTVITAAAVVTGGVAGIDYVTDIFSEKKVVPVPEVKIPELNSAVQIKTPVSLFSFTGTEETSLIAKRATDIFYNKLKAERGEDNVFLSKRPGNKGYLLTGSVEKMTSGYVITAKIIDSGRGVILDIETTEIKSEKELYSGCTTLVKKISRNLK